MKTKVILIVTGAIALLSLALNTYFLIDNNRQDKSITEEITVEVEEDNPNNWKGNENIISINARLPESISNETILLIEMDRFFRVINVHTLENTYSIKNLELFEIDKNNKIKQRDPIIDPRKEKGSSSIFKNRSK